MQHGHMTGIMARSTSVMTIVGIAVFTTATPAYAEEKGEKLCEVGDDRLQELSGLVVADDGYFAVTDGTEQTSQMDVYGLDDSCKNGGTGVTAFEIDPFDPEDLAMDEDGNFWVADTGDNQGQRDTVALHMVNPDDGAGTTYRFTYPDGEKPDAEALLMQSDGTPVIATKEPGKSRLFAPEGEMSADAETPLKELGAIEIEATKTKGGPESIGGVPLGDSASMFVTGGAVSPDGKKAVLRTYTDAYEYKVSDGDVGKSITAKDAKPAVTPLPGEPQGEAIAYTDDGKKFVTASEAEVDESGEVTTPPQMWTYTPAKAGSGGDDKGSGEEEKAGPGLAKSILSALGPDGILWLVAGIGVIGLIMILIGVRAIVKARRKAAEEDDDPLGPDDRDDDATTAYRGATYSREDDGLGGGRLFEPPPPRGDREHDDWPHGGGDRYGEGRSGSIYGGRDGDGRGGMYGGGDRYGEGRSGSVYGGRDDEGRSGSIYGGRR